VRFWSEAYKRAPELAKMDPKKARDIALPGSDLVKPDQTMWQSRKAAFIQSQAEFDIEAFRENDNDTCD